MYAILIYLYTLTSLSLPSPIPRDVLSRMILYRRGVCPQLVRGLFEDFDGNRDGVVSHAEFEEGYRWVDAASIYVRPVKIQRVKGIRKRMTI